MKEMKTFHEVRQECISDISTAEMMGQDKKYSFGQIEEMAAKEYAKQWVHEFALQTFHHLDEYNYNVMLTQLEPRIIKEIDAQ